MLRFTEEIMLLILDDKGGKFAHVPRLWLHYALAGAVLMDLALECLTSEPMGQAEEISQGRISGSS